MIGTKICRRCKQEQPSGNFGVNPKYSDGLQSYCKVCQREYSKQNYKENRDIRLKQTAEYAKTHPEVRRKAVRKYRSSLTPEQRSTLYRRCDLLRNFGLTPIEYEKIFESQDGVCAICKRICSSGRRLAVDHCHMTGRVRGLLCSRCNLGIGQFNDSVELLEAAIEYLGSREAYTRQS